jgi:hypothetical protein
MRRGRAEMLPSCLRGSIRGRKAVFTSSNGGESLGTYSYLLAPSRLNHVKIAIESF